ncbi:DnaD domain protein [Lachnospiraceae bacterium ASD3451]|uniref:DnaD domain protein n=1 Tax=Diplocloster agilis TaxID=2850323 RepID=UPI001DE0B5AF|nr:DnaD domain protein [Diplocloster agilis]MBU9745570.1 DnaD domain protein [Diplocloster agilis]
MGSIHLYSKNNPDSTMVSNHFIDTYMPEANGEFVKVYLYLLRCLSTSAAKAPEVSISSIADRFNHTEKDVKRALKYWEKLNLLQLEYGEDKSLKSICITEGLQAAKLAEEQVSVTAADPKAPAPVTARQTSPRQDAPRQETAELPSYSTGQLEAFLQKEEIRQLIFIAEQYLGKPLSPSEVTYILFFHDELHFSAELIEYLIEYCISKGSKSFRYMKTVALAWSDAHISTIQQAKEASAAYNRNYYAVMKAFGIKGRAPAEPEAAYIRKWLEEYAFSLDIILEACNRTISSIHQPSFEYADSILKKWKSNNIRHLSDIRTLDEEHEKTKDTRKTARAKTAPETNKFNNFHQRNYDYEQLEKQLLHTR